MVEIIRRIILKWLLDEDIETYIELLKENNDLREKYINEIREHIETLQTYQELYKDYKDIVEITKKMAEELKSKIGG